MDWSLNLSETLSGKTEEELQALLDHDQIFDDFIESFFPSHEAEAWTDSVVNDIKRANLELARWLQEFTLFSGRKN